MDGGIPANPIGEVEHVARNARLSNRRMVSQCVKVSGQRCSQKMSLYLLLSCLLLLLSHTATASTTLSPTPSTPTTSAQPPPSPLTSPLSSTTPSSSTSSSTSSSSSSSTSPSSSSLTAPSSSPPPPLSNSTLPSSLNSTPSPTPSSPSSSAPPPLSNSTSPSSLNSTSSSSLNAPSSSPPPSSSSTSSSSSTLLSSSSLTSPSSSPPTPLSNSTSPSSLNSTSPSSSTSPPPASTLPTTTTGRSSTQANSTSQDTTPATALSSDTTVVKTTFSESPGNTTLDTTIVSWHTTTSNGNATQNTSADPDNTTSNPTTTPSSPKDFYYWMVVYVDVIGGTINGSNVTEWLTKAFLTHLDACDTPADIQNSTTASPSVTLTQPTNMSSKAAYDYTSQSTTTTDPNITMTSTMPATETVQTLASTQTTLWTMNFSTTLNESSTRAGNGTVKSVFQDIDVCCEQKEGISETTCSVVVKLSAPRSSCCFLHALRNFSLTSSESILATIQNNKVKLIKGIIPAQSTAAPSGGNISACNSSQTCSSNITSSSVNCTSTEVPPDSNADTCSDFEPPCDCSQSCGATAYYSMDITIRNSITPKNVTAMVNQLNDSSIQNRNISIATHQALVAISAVYQKCNVVCWSAGFYHVIITLSQPQDICTVNTALSYLLNQTGILIMGEAWRVAICGGNETLSDNLQCGNITVERKTFNDQQFCDSRKVLWSFLKCQPGRTTIVLLNQTCTGSDHTDASIKSSTTAPSTLPSTSPSTTRSVTTANHVSSNTTRSANTTTSAGGSTSSSTTQNSGAPVTNVSTSATQTTLRANVSTVTNSSTVSTVTNSSTVSTVTNSSSVSGVTGSSSVTVNTTPQIHNQGTATVTATTTAASNISAEEEANRLLALTQDASSLNSSQVEQLVSQLEVLLSGPNVSLALGTTSVHITNNLLNASVQAVASSATRLIRIVDTVGLKLVVKEQSESILFDSLALAVSRVDGTNFRETTFSLANPSDLQIRSRVARSVSWLEGRSNTPQGAITLPSTLTQNLSLQQQQEASRVQFNFYQRSTFFQDKGLGSGELNSGILSTSVSNLSISGLQDNVTITLRHNKPIPENSTVFCAFWDFALNDGSGGWNDDGCTVVNVTDNRTICSCSHLTSFGILLDLSRGEGVTSRLQANILTYITYIGCGISAIFLSVTLLTYLGFGKLRKDIPSKILIQLCFALLLLNLTFLLDAWLALYPDAVGLCISTAFFLHYFLLCTFTWMGLEAVHMYIALVKVFNNYISRFMLKFSLIGWGVPMAVVIIVIAIDKDNYGLVSYGKFDDGTSDEFCWLRNDTAFYVAVVAYFCVIFLMNLVMFVVVLVQLYRIKRQNPHNSQHRSHLQDARSVAGLTVLLGLTWGFAFFAWGPVNLAFMYLFAIFNTLQGFFIFILHCAVKENVRRQWRTYLCCGKLRLSENSDWSRTATQNKNRAPSSYAYSRSQNSSSSTTCLAPDSSVHTQSTRGSPSDDRMMSDSDTNSDVVQNEINNQYQNPSYSQAEWIRRPSGTRGP